MALETPPRTGIGDRLLGARAWPRWVLGTWIALWVNVVSGTLVRVSNSGLGCPNWPTCQGGRPIPESIGHQTIEFTNRVLAFIVIVLTVMLALSAWRAVRASDPVRWRMALAIAIGTVAQGPLGGITVLTHLNPIVVMCHFLLAAVIFTVATVLLVDVRGAGTRADVDVPGWLLPAVIGFSLLAFVLIVSGAVTTMSGTHPGSSKVHRLGNLLDNAYWHVRIAVAYVGALAGLLIVAARIPRTLKRVAPLAWTVVGLTGLQILIGEYQWRHQLPWYLVLAHVSTAVLLWGAVVALGRSLLPRRA